MDVLKKLQTAPTSPRERLHATITYSIQAVICACVLFFAYRAVGAPLVPWAIISALLVLQPGVEASLTVSITRIAANLVGCAVGVAVGVLLGDHFWQVLLALVACVFLCQQLRLNGALRSACVAVIIVMMLSSDRGLVRSSIARAGDVIVGSALAVIVQFITDRLRRKLTPPP